ncbi:MAG: threonylcarbamoyl-AMP synthase [Sphingobacteriales bacterium]|nr:MAG: threonylcarbamoyl-AMP synthase [Sphingobacteriales bacterium]TAF81080.1 MAG: threonylcarbamoyl-AMP synthase [Sphingobacteriales bacterium]
MITPHIHKAIQVLNSQGIVAIPTETVYGLAGNIYSKTAIKNIFETKQRPFYNPLIVHISSLQKLDEVAVNIPEVAYKLANVFWPGPLTLVLDKNKNIPLLVTGGKNTVAVRIPNHPIALALLNQLDYPLAAPSANLFGQLSPTSAAHVLASFKTHCPLVLDGGICQSGVESTIVGFESGKAIIYRLGAIAQEAIEAVIGILETKTLDNAAPQAPGMLSKHYAPRTKLILSNNISDSIGKYSDLKIGLLLFKNYKGYSIAHQEVLSANGNLTQAASNLYAALHRLDNCGLDVIIAERMPNDGLGCTINDRLERGTK